MRKIAPLLTLLFLLYGNAFAALTTSEAKTLMESVHQRLLPLINEQGLEIETTIEEGDKPGAYSKWLKKRKIGKIQVFHRLLERDSLNQAGFMMIICHEFGHFLGGAPFVRVPRSGSIFSFSNPYERMSVEGQADFFVTKVCTPLIYDLLEVYTFDYDEREEMISFCLGKKPECYSSMIAIESGMTTLNEILFDLGKDESFSLGRSSLRIAPRILDLAGEYPSMQCRIDTLKAGIEDHQERPSCWYR
ncbi:MAG: hypothetical protein NXH75_07025 [Halobacteriovoraceae bacterium]|nr:hypothetical protein [Halobacteriovoraceae bacterium]